MTPAEAAVTARLQVRGLKKAFGGVQALAGAALSALPGEVGQHIVGAT